MARVHMTTDACTHALRRAICTRAGDSKAAAVGANAGTSSKVEAVDMEVTQELKGMSLKEKKKVEELMAEECDQRWVSAARGAVEGGIW
jgi:hypothetical protein